MKQTSIVFFITFIFIIIFSACQENMYMDWKLRNDSWYSVHKSDPGFITTPSGLCYKVIHQGVQRYPNVNSVVIVSYKGTLVDGTIFDSTATGATTQISLSTAIPGWKEGLPKMQSGGNYIFYVPSKIGYDTVSTNPVIPPYSVLKFDVHLIDSYN